MHISDIYMYKLYIGASIVFNIWFYLAKYICIYRCICIIQRESGAWVGWPLHGLIVWVGFSSFALKFQ